MAKAGSRRAAMDWIGLSFMITSSATSATAPGADRKAQKLVQAERASSASGSWQRDCAPPPAASQPRSVHARAARDKQILINPIYFPALAIDFGIASTRAAA